MELDNFKYNLLKLKKCDQFWDDMKPVLGGRHCKSCSKTIVDFTSMTYSEIAIFMSESEKPVCGFYLPEQLSGRHKYIKSVPLKIGLSTLLTTTAVSYGQSQINQLTVETIIESPKAFSENVIEEVSSPLSDTLIIKGKIQYFDTTNKVIAALPYASVIIKGTKIGVASNAMGEFNLKYLPTSATEQIIIVISAVAVQTKELKADFQNQNEIDFGLITLDKYKDDYVEFYVTGKKRSWINRFWRKITFRKKSYYKYN